MATLFFTAEICEDGRAKLEFIDLDTHTKCVRIDIKNGQALIGAAVADPCEQATPTIIRAIGKLSRRMCTEAAEFCTALLEAGAVQVVFDAALGKFRPCHLLKDGVKIYGIPGTEEFRTEADDEKTAGRRIAGKVTTAMANAPARAGELSQWFAGGMPVELVSDHKAPEYVPVRDVVPGFPLRSS